MSNYLYNDKLKSLQSHFAKLSNSQNKATFDTGKKSVKKAHTSKKQKHHQVKNENPYLVAKNCIKTSPKKEDLMEKQSIKLQYCDQLFQGLSQTFELQSNQHQPLQEQQHIIIDESLPKKQLVEQINQSLQEQQLNSPIFQKTGQISMEKSTFQCMVQQQSKQLSQQQQQSIQEQKENTIEVIKEELTTKHQNTVQQRIIKNQKMVESAVTCKYQAQFEGKIHKFFHKMTNKKINNEKTFEGLNQISPQNSSFQRNFITENIARQGHKQKKLLNLSQPKMAFQEEKVISKEQYPNKKIEIYNYYIDNLRKVELIKFTINMPQLNEGLAKFDTLMYFIEIDNIKVHNEVESQNYQLVSMKYGQEYYSNFSKQYKFCLVLLKKIYNLFAIEKNGDMAFTTRQMLNFLKVFNIMKTFTKLTHTQIEIFCSKETIHKKGINFLGFLEILYSISKHIYDEENLSSGDKFKLFVDEQLKPEFVAISNRLIDYNIEKIKVFFQPYNTFENPTGFIKINLEIINLLVELFVECDNFLKHDLKYSKESYITLNNFIKLCKNYEIIPNLCRYYQIIKLFRTFQDGDQEKIRFQGFIMILCCIAHISFSASEYESEFKGFYKKIWKIFEILIDADCKYSEGIMNWGLSKPKE